MAGNTAVQPPMPGGGGLFGGLGGAQSGLFGALTQGGWHPQQAAQVSGNPFVQFAALHAQPMPMFNGATNSVIGNLIAQRQAQPQPQPAHGGWNGMIHDFSQRVSAARANSDGNPFHLLQAVAHPQPQPQPQPMPMPPMHADPGPGPQMGNTGGFIPSGFNSGGLRPPVMRADPGPGPADGPTSQTRPAGMPIQQQPMPQPPGFGLGRFG